jgi:hypothetical protein
MYIHDNNVSEIDRILYPIKVVYKWTERQSGITGERKIRVRHEWEAAKLMEKWNNMVTPAGMPEWTYEIVKIEKTSKQKDLSVERFVDEYNENVPLDEITYRDLVILTEFKNWLDRGGNL